MVFDLVLDHARIDAELFGERADIDAGRSAAELGAQDVGGREELGGEGAAGALPPGATAGEEARSAATSATSTWVALLTAQPADGATSTWVAFPAMQPPAVCWRTLAAAT